MDEYIERSAAHDAVVDAIWHGKRSMYSVANSINSVPSADVAPVRHGRWEGYSHTRYCGIDDFGDPIYKDGVAYYCSECMRKTVIKEKYCPSCGAKMDLEEA